jgi:hypothetical protein
MTYRICSHHFSPYTNSRATASFELSASEVCPELSLLSSPSCLADISATAAAHASVRSVLEPLELELLLLLLLSRVDGSEDEAGDLENGETMSICVSYEHNEEDKQRVT